jgi:hypothetical protein
LRRPRLAPLPARLRLVPASQLTITPAPAAHPPTPVETPRQPLTAKPVERPPAERAPASAAPAPSILPDAAVATQTVSEPRRRTHWARTSLFAGLFVVTLGATWLAGNALVDRPSGVAVPEQRTPAPVPAAPAPAAQIAPTGPTAPAAPTAPALAEAPTKPAAAPETPRHAVHATARHHRAEHARAKPGWRYADRRSAPHADRRSASHPPARRRHPDHFLDRLERSLAPDESEGPAREPSAYCGDYPDIRPC